MTTDDLITALLVREAGFVDNPVDRGGATNFGITRQTLTEWRGRAVTVADVKALTEAEARAIYEARYLRPFALVPFEELRTQLVDYGVLSGPLQAIRTLQRVLGVPVDGVLGARTLSVLSSVDWRIVNQALMGARVKFYIDLVDQDPSQLVFLFGWVKRAVSFSV